MRNCLTLRCVDSEITEFGGWFREMREGRGLTQSELAEQMHVDQTLISRIELGKLEPTANVCLAFARALGLPIDYVLHKAGFVDALDVDREPEDEATWEFRWRIARVTDSDERRRVLDNIWTLLDAAAKRGTRPSGNLPPARRKSANGKRGTVSRRRYCGHS